MMLLDTYKHLDRRFPAHIEARRPVEDSGLSRHRRGQGVDTLATASSDKSQDTRRRHTQPRPLPADSQLYRYNEDTQAGTSLQDRQSVSTGNLGWWIMDYT